MKKKSFVFCFYIKNQAEYIFSMQVFLLGKKSFPFALIQSAFIM